jgi:hypothetical protein
MNINLALYIMLGVLLMNFIHTFTYSFQWVIKEEVSPATIKIEKDGKKINIEVGGLLTGNPQNIIGCKAQGFLLIFSSISQDFLINIFFYLVNSSDHNEKFAKYATFFLGILFPFLFTLILEICKSIGINDEFCYVKKFDFDIENNLVTYKLFGSFQLVVMIVYGIRIINFIFTCYFLQRILAFVKSNKKPSYYIFKSIIIPIIQLFTIGIGVLYRFLNLISPKLSVSLAAPYLILNTSDGILFPIGFIIQNNLFVQIKKLCSSETTPEEIEDEPIEFLERPSEESE